MKHSLMFAALVLLACAPASAAVIDFEDAAAFGGDDAVATDAYFSRYGVTFSAVAGQNVNQNQSVSMAFELVGEDAVNAFIGNGTGDGIREGNPGTYFLRAVGTSEIRHIDSKYFNLRIDFSETQTAASGEIWDIDAREQYQVTAFNSSGAEVASLTSPVGGLDGVAFAWSFESGAEIDAIEIEFTGQDVRGFALDNFAFTGGGESAQTPLAAPLPPALPIAVLGLIGMNFTRKRRQVQLEGQPEQDAEVDRTEE